MSELTEADTIRILVSTDNHVGYNERDPVRGDDSWKTFDEIMGLAKDRDVDMVLLAGDLFHENKPSRKAMYQVMRSLRMNCYGDKPCELELLSDASENFHGPFNHVNYEDLDINVAIPVFSIHGNHDDPSGEGHLAALDILQVAGLLNYFGRTPESDNIQVKPVLLQKGRTKLALYGMSNVRDERLFRTFRDQRVKFYQPSLQKSDWFNLMCVHQNHHAHTETGYLPEEFLPDFLDLVIWGHEHECLINPRLNPQTNFHVMQPGSSVATSLVPGEAVPKHVAILTITGRDFKVEPIRLKTVRPFIMRDIVLHEEKEAARLARKENNRTELTRFLMSIVEELIEEARNEWLESQEEWPPDGEQLEVPLPLVRLRVEVSAPDGGNFDCENPQRFSNRFVGKVANVNDVVQFYRKKKTANALSRTVTDLPDESVVSHLAALDTVKVERLVKEFLTAQSLTILPQNSFDDAVSQFVDKDDKHAMEMFVNESLESQIKHLLSLDRGDEDEEYDEDAARNKLHAAMERYRTQLEEMFAKGKTKRARGRKRFKPKPDGWDTEFDGVWEDQPGALILSDQEGSRRGDEEDDDDDDVGRPTTSTRRRGAVTAATTSTTRGARSGRARGSAATTTTTTTRGGARKTATATTTATTARGRRAVPNDDDNDDDDESPPDDAIMLDDVDEAPDTAIVDDDDEDSLFVRQSQPAAPAPSTGSRTTTSRRSRRAPTPTTTGTSRTTRKAVAAAPAKTKQSTLPFASQSQSQVGVGVGKRPTRSAAVAAKAKQTVISDDDIDDESDAFEPVPATGSGRRRRW
ncbi:hypothetical protein VTO42DRAFT_2393 [Malbranchea cinnamomea]